MARAALVAEKRGTFGDAHHWLFMHQEQKLTQKLAAVAALAGLPPEELLRQASEPDIVQALSKSKAEAIKLGVDSTPTIFFVDSKGRVFTGTDPRQIDAAIKADQ